MVAASSDPIIFAFEQSVPSAPLEVSFSTQTIQSDQVAKGIIIELLPVFSRGQFSFAFGGNTVLVDRDDASTIGVVASTTTTASTATSTRAFRKQWNAPRACA